MRLVLFIYLVVFLQNTLASQSFEKGTKVLYIGSAASSRYFDQNLFKEKTEDYNRSPIVAIGLDYCFSSVGDISNSRLGIGPYFSTWSAVHRFTDNDNNSLENHWTDIFSSIRFTHHLTYFIREKLDMCSGVIIGLRYKHYHYIEKNNQNVARTYDKQQFYPAIGLTASIRYYFLKNIGVFGEGAVGYKTDMYLFGICYKIQS